MSLRLADQHGTAPRIRVPPSAPTNPYAGTVDGAGNVTRGGSGTTVLTGIKLTRAAPISMAASSRSPPDANLGDAAGALNFNGSKLQVMGTGFNATPSAIHWGADGGAFDIADAANTFAVSQVRGPVPASSRSAISAGKARSSSPASTPYTGPTDIQNDTLLLIGSITSDTTVQAAGALAGNGIVTGDVSNFGNVTPGTPGDSPASS